MSARGPRRHSNDAIGLPDVERRSGFERAHLWHEHLSMDAIRRSLPEDPVLLVDVWVRPTADVVFPGSGIRGERETDSGAPLPICSTTPSAALYIQLQSGDCVPDEYHLRPTDHCHLPAAL